MALQSVGLSTQIYNNHLKSILLLAGFPALLLLMIGSFFVALDMMSQAGVPGFRDFNWPHAIDAAKAGLFTYGHWAFMAAGIWFVIAYFFHGHMMRAATGSRPITREQEPKLYNMLENLCISRGLTMPSFEMIDSPALNAFASGINEKTYRIVLTRGLVESLQDDELEAVIAHELTHIINRDVRLLIVSVIFVGIISFLAETVFRMLVHGRPRSNNRNGKGGGFIVVMIIGLVILAIGYLLATVIRFALSRKREYLADAGAVELTKNPEAMMRALQRISGQDKVTGMPDEVQQMCIENSANFMGIFATHPPINDRIRTIAGMTGTSIPEISALPPKQTAEGPWG